MEIRNAVRCGFFLIYCKQVNERLPYMNLFRIYQDQCTWYIKSTASIYKKTTTKAKKTSANELSANILFN